jgi:Armadillo/beta-catenin-like repeat
MLCLLLEASQFNNDWIGTCACNALQADLQEAVCDLLWSLAFNNSLVKEAVGRQGGISLILKALATHVASADLVKSACGALSNMCQSTYNQNLIAAHGGVKCILSALAVHRSNAALLPFAFDVLASLIVVSE